MDTEDPRLPSPGLMLVGCKRCKWSKERIAASVPHGMHQDWACGTCRRTWRYDGDTKEWTLTGHIFIEEDA